MPIISTINDLVDTGDRITLIEGVFSGTLSYLLNAFSSLPPGNTKWSRLVKDAREMGYTEPDPRDDLNGMDVARKLTIVGRLAGVPIESPAAFHVESLIPTALEGVASVDEFLQRLPDHDDLMEQKSAAAAVNSKVLRFIGSVDVRAKQVKVGLEQVDARHPAALLKGSDNIISIYTERYGDMPLTIRGAGAGGSVTAMGVTSDLLKVLRRM